MQNEILSSQNLSVNILITLRANLRFFLKASFLTKPFLECKNRQPAPRNTLLTVSSETSFLTPAVTLNCFMVNDPYCSRSMGIWPVALEVQVFFLACHDYVFFYQQFCQLQLRYPTINQKPELRSNGMVTPAIMDFRIFHFLLIWYDRRQFISKKFIP